MALKKPTAKRAAPKAKVALSSKAKVTKAAKPAVKAAAKPAVKKSSKPIAVKQTKAQLLTEVAETADLEKKHVKALFVALRELVERHVHPKGSGEIVIPELGIKVRRVKKPATKARKGRNPFTGEEITIKAKPARNSIKVTAMKALKELAE